MALLRALSGLLLWALAFSAIYGLQGLICAPDLSGAVAQLPYAGRELLIALWLGFLLLSGWLIVRVWQRKTRKNLLDWLALVLAITGGFATLFTGFPVLFASVCS